MREQEFNDEDDVDDDDDDNGHVEAFTDDMHVCDTLHVNMDSIRHYIWFVSYSTVSFLSIDVRVEFMLHNGCVREHTHLYLFDWM